MISWPGFDRLTHIDSGYCFFLFLFNFIFNLILQYCVDWELRSIIYFYLFSIGLSQSYNLSNMLSWLTWFFSQFFKLIFFQSYPSILDWMRVRLYNLFQFEFYEVILFLWIKSRVCLVDLCDFYVFF